MSLEVLKIHIERLVYLRNISEEQLTQIKKGDRNLAELLISNEIKN
jgi:hypothetical protein